MKLYIDWCFQSILRSQFHAMKKYNYYGHVLWLALPVIPWMDSTILCNKSMYVCDDVCVYFIDAVLTSHVCLHPVNIIHTMVLGFCFRYMDWTIMCHWVQTSRSYVCFDVGLSYVWLCLKLLRYIFIAVWSHEWLYTYLFPIKLCNAARLCGGCSFAELIKRYIYILCWLAFTWATASKFICVCVTYFDVVACVERGGVMHRWYHEWCNPLFIMWTKCTKLAMLLRPACIYTCCSIDDETMWSWARLKAE